MKKINKKARVADPKKFISQLVAGLNPKLNNDAPLRSRGFVNNSLGFTHHQTNMIWEIVSALRGPDLESSCDLKHFTTCRIRSVLGMSNLVASHDLPLTPEQMSRRDRLLAHAPKHFQSHYHGAVRAVREIYKYDLETETQL